MGNILEHPRLIFSKSQRAIWQDVKLYRGWMSSLIWQDSDGKIWIQDADMLRIIWNCLAKPAIEEFQRSRCNGQEKETF